MAEKILKSLKFPGLEDTYIIPEINAAGSSSLPIYSENGELKPIEGMVLDDYDSENDISYSKVAITSQGIDLTSDAYGGNSTHIGWEDIKLFGGVGNMSLNGD